MATIEEYPFAVSLCKVIDRAFLKFYCGGTILSRTAILSAAHCFWDVYRQRVEDITNWRGRVGSSFEGSGGTIYALQRLFSHPEYDHGMHFNDVAVVRTREPMEMIPKMVARAPIAGPYYQVKDDEDLWVIGWGISKFKTYNTSEQLVHVKIKSINQALCRKRYEDAKTITDGMMCSGWLDGKLVGSCQGDSGGPVLHKGTVVGITSFGIGCAHPFYLDVNVRVSYYSNWIATSATTKD